MAHLASLLVASLVDKRAQLFMKPLFVATRSGLAGDFLETLKFDFALRVQAIFHHWNYQDKRFEQAPVLTRELVRQVQQIIIVSGASPPHSI